MDEDLPNTNNRQETDTPATLQDTVWKWNNLTLKFINAEQAQLSGETLLYSFNEAAMTGTVQSAGAFTITADFITLTFADYKGAGSRSFTNQNSAMSGTVWRYGYAALNFISIRKVKSHDEEYAYTYNTETKTGTIDVLGDFTVADASLTFSNYRTSSIPVVYEQGNVFNNTYANTLIGTAWGWNNSWNGWMVLEFFDAGKMMLTHTGSVYHDNTPFEFTYTYTDGPKTGSIPGLGNFGINGNAMVFPQWKDYGHSAATQG
jgi:hypothetical protein